MPSLNDRINEAQKDRTPTINYIALFFVIALGVAAGNLSSNYLTARYAEYKLEKATKAMTDRLKAQTERIQAETKKLTEENRIRAEELKRESDQQEQIKRKLNETCTYWINEHNKLRNDTTRGHRDVACRQAGRPFNN